MKLCKYLLFVLCALLCTILALPAAADADTTAHDKNEGTLTISYTYQDEDGNEHALKSADFDLYRVANLTEADGLTTTEAFAEISIPQNLFTDQKLLIETKNKLEHFVDTNPIPSDYVITTNGKGEVVIDLPLGLYYIDAQLFWDDETTGNTVSAYYSAPFLVLIGAVDPETGDYIYDYTAFPKVSNISIEKETLSVAVKKVWKNTTHTTPPKEIEVALYCEHSCDETAQAITLSAANNWSYTWEDLDANCTWAVRETDQLKDYKIQYETTVEGGQFVFVITNTFTGTPNPTPPPSTPPPSTPPPTGTLPQTGSNLPYVPLFAGLGIGLIALGLLLKKGGDGECS